MTDKVMKAKVRELLKDCHPTYTEKDGTVSVCALVDENLVIDKLTTALSQAQAEARGEDRKYKEKMFIDATPDGDYALRLLRAYRDDCDLTWADTSGKKSKNLLIVEMNRLQKLRAKELNKAIFHLTKLLKEKKI